MRILDEGREGSYHSYYYALKMTGLGENGEVRGSSLILSSRPPPPPTHSLSPLLSPSHRDMGLQAPLPRPPVVSALGHPRKPPLWALQLNMVTVSLLYNLSSIFEESKPSAQPSLRKEWLCQRKPIGCFLWPWRDSGWSWLNRTRRVHR